MSGALNGSSVRVTRTPPPVTDSVSRRPAWPFAATGPFAADGPPVRAGSASPAGFTGAPWVRARHRDAKSDRRYRAVAPGCAAREPVTASSAAPPLVRARLHGGSLPAGTPGRQQPPDRHESELAALLLNSPSLVIAATTTDAQPGSPCGSFSWRRVCRSQRPGCCDEGAN